MNERVRGNERDEQGGGRGRENIRQLFTRQLRGITSVHERPTNDSEAARHQSVLDTDEISRNRDTDTRETISLSSPEHGTYTGRARASSLIRGSRNWIILSRARGDDRRKGIGPRDRYLRRTRFKMRLETLKEKREGEKCLN